MVLHLLHLKPGGETRSHRRYTANGGLETSIVRYYAVTGGRETIIRSHHPFYSMVGNVVEIKRRRPCPTYVKRGGGSEGGTSGTLDKAGTAVSPTVGVRAILDACKDDQIESRGKVRWLLNKFTP